MTNLTYNQERVGDYIQTYTGKKFYINNPKAEDFTVLDIAHSLSNLARFTGHSERFYSVGEHSIHCYDLALFVGATPLQQLYALCHDASESVMNDLARPVKQNVPQYKALEDKIMEVMWEVLGVPSPTEEDYKLVKQIDNTLIVLEMSQIMNRNNYDSDGLDYIKIAHKDIRNGYGAGESKAEFLYIFHYLKDKIKKEGVLNENK